MYDSFRLIEALENLLENNERLERVAADLYYDVDALKGDIRALIDDFDS